MFLKTYNTDFDVIVIPFAEQKIRLLEIEDNSQFDTDNWQFDTVY